MYKFPLIFILLIFSSISANSEEDFLIKLAKAAENLTLQNVSYDPSYFSIPYPNGDVPKDKGVCTDVIIRAYRALGIDLQKEVHEDMKAHFESYPKNWGLKKTDTNIDHRRVPNLMTFFKRNQAQLAITNKPKDYQAGDIVCWNLHGGINHIGIVSTQYHSTTKKPLIVHNIGAGQVLEDCLFNFKIIGHYRYKKD